MLNATKIRLYPTTEQEPIFAAQFGCTRFVWNKALGMKKAAWEERQESLSCYTIKSMLPVWKSGEFPWLKECDSQALQQTILNLDVAYKNFFAKRAKFPRFKKKHAARQSFQYPQRVTLGEGSVFLPKIGNVKAVIHRPILGKIKTVSQCVALALVLLENPIFSGMGFPMDQVFVYLSTIITIWSGVDYIYKNRKMIKAF